MSRKDDSKAKDAIITVNIDDFTRTRDAVIMSLATLQSAVSDLSRAYINHANTVLNRGNLDVGGITSNSITSSLLENGLLGNRHASPGVKSEAGEKKKRKRAPHDPNAPKRALTPYFLYMQHNRAQIAQELGANAKPKDVADEGTRRWAAMPEAQKEVWKKLYADNLAVYKEKMKAYKAGLPIPDDDNIKAANQLQQDAAATAEAASAEESEEEEEQEAEEEESSPEPTKEPTPPRSGKRRRTGENIKPAKEASSPSNKKGSPDKKKKASNSNPKAEPSSARKSTGGAPDQKRSKKKRKSEAGAEE
ncbi:putative HMG box protein [Thermoascus aurantiacus ATCC 26904]